MNDITDAKYFQQHLFINEKLLALGRVAIGIAHEINNPLYAVLANAEQISDDKNINEESKEYAKEIIDHIMYISNIIKDLSSYSKSLRKEEYTEIDLNKVIEESLKLVKYSTNYLDVTVNTKFSKLPDFYAAKGEMQQIFINLFNNAVDAMNGAGELKITSKYKDKEILISVSDTGYGISKENQKHIFDLFFTTKDPGKGTGQGLHIVKKILQKYNSEINLKSKEGKGTTFYLKFKTDKI
ncbi:Signal transduction histidine-protein kinase AtoS [subsurface metagenome]